MIGWKTTNHGQLSAHLPYHHTCARFSNFDVNDVTRNLDCWRNKLRVHVTLHTRILNAHGDPKFSFKRFNLYGPTTKTTWNWKNCYLKNTSFCNYYYYYYYCFLLYFIFFFKYKPFFNRIVVLFLFSCHDSCNSKPYFPLNYRSRFFLINNG